MTTPTLQERSASAGPRYRPGQVVWSGKTTRGRSVDLELRRRLERFLFVPPTRVAYTVMRLFGRMPLTCAAGLVLAELEKHCASREMLRECRTVDEVNAIVEMLGLEADFQFRRRTFA